MGTRKQGMVASLLLEAEEQNRLLVPHDRCLRRRLDRMVERGVAFRPSQGIYVRADYWRSLKDNQKALHMIRALSEREPAMVFSHTSAALVHGLEVPWHLQRKLHAIMAPGHAARSSGWVVRHISEGCPTATVDGIRVTSVEQTVFDCLRTLDLPEGLAVVDSSLRGLELDPDALRTFFDERRRRRGYCHAAQTLSLADPRSENGGESIARGTMLEMGYMPPDLQVEVNDPIGGGTYRADFLWRIDEGNWVIGELDGKDKYYDEDMTKGRSIDEVLLDERLRESRINARGIRVMRFRFSELSNRLRLAELLDLFGIPKGYLPPEDLPHPRLGDGVTFRRLYRMP